MGISAVLQIADRLLSGEFQQGADKSANGKTAANQNSAKPADVGGGDRFTPSRQASGTKAASEAGIFQVEQFRFTAINLGTANPVAVSQNATGATQTTAPAAAPAAASAAQNAVATTAPAASAAASSAIVPQAAASSQDSLQSLNAALVSLGLNPVEIAAFDQFAKLLLLFNPNALQDLQNQLHELAAEFAASNTTNTAPAPAATTTGQATGQTAPAAQQGFQLTELSVSFTGINETLTQGGNTSQFSAFQLQVQEVRVSLTSPAGQTVRVQSPAPSATAPPATAAAAPALAKAATA